MLKSDDVRLFNKVIDKIRMETDDNKISIMEICGTHTRAIRQYGINNLIGDNIRLLSGPGCPICVAPSSYIDNAVSLAKYSRNIIVTFGDLMRIPGENGNLIDARQRGGNITVVYSPFDALSIAEKNQDRNVIFLGVGFETTVPAIAVMLKKAKESNLKNFYMLYSLKSMPEIMEYILKDSKEIDGVLCPGHVAAITGISSFNFIAKRYGIPMSVGGFRPMEIATAIFTIAKMIRNGECRCSNSYTSTVRDEGNVKARHIAEEVFEKADGLWRGIGIVKSSGYILRDDYKKFDAVSKFNLSIMDRPIKSGCICSEVLIGRKVPRDCKLFGKKCTPETAVGPCMVSMEGCCRAEYDFGRR